MLTFYRHYWLLSHEIALLCWKCCEIPTNHQ